LGARASSNHGDNQRIEKLTNLETSYPFWSPDGASLVFQSNRNDDNSEIYIMKADGTGIRRVTHHPATDQTPIWSPDGARIVFQSDRDGNRELYSVAPDGSDLVKLTDHPGEDSHPKFSPDGSRIIFDSDRADIGGATQIYEMNPDGSHVQRVTHYEETDSYASISPNGVKVLFRRVLPTGGNTASGRNSEVFLMDRDGSNPVNLTRHPAYDGWPAFSPDNERIAFASDREEKGVWHIYIMNGDGSDPRRMTPEDPGGYFTKPIFSPDGSKLVCTRTKDGNVEIFTIDLEM
jgi:TolB protein